MTATDHTTATVPVTDGIVLTDGAAGKVQSLLEGEGRDDLALAGRRAAGWVLGSALPAVLRRAPARRRHRQAVRQRQRGHAKDEKPETAALRDFCHALINLNEFLYVD